MFLFLLYYIYLINFFITRSHNEKKTNPEWLDLLFLLSGLAVQESDEHMTVKRGWADFHAWLVSLMTMDNLKMTSVGSHGEHDKRTERLHCLSFCVSTLHHQVYTWTFYLKNFVAVGDNVHLKWETCHTNTAAVQVLCHLGGTLKKLLIYDEKV